MYNVLLLCYVRQEGDEETPEIAEGSKPRDYQNG